jgi:hypothetical protein
VRELVIVPLGFKQENVMKELPSPTSKFPRKLFDTVRLKTKGFVNLELLRIFPKLFSEMTTVSPSTFLTYLCFRKLQLLPKETPTTIK